MARSVSDDATRTPRLPDPKTGLMTIGKEFRSPGGTLTPARLMTSRNRALSVAVWAAASVTPGRDRESLTYPVVVSHRPVGTGTTSRIPADSARSRTRSWSRMSAASKRSAIVAPGASLRASTARTCNPMRCANRINGTCSGPAPMESTVSATSEQIEFQFSDHPIGFRVQILGFRLRNDHSVGTVTHHSTGGLKRGGLEDIELSGILKSGVQVL